MKCPNDGSALVPHPRGIMHCPICPFNVPQNEREMTELFAWVSVDSEGREGFMAADITGNGTMMVLCHSKEHKAMELEDWAREAVRTIPGYRTRLVRFSGRAVVKECSS